MFLNDALVRRDSGKGMEKIDVMNNSLSFITVVSSFDQGRQRSFLEKVQIILSVTERFSREELRQKMCRKVL